MRQQCVRLASAPLAAVQCSIELLGGHRRNGCAAHAPVTKSTLRTADHDVPLFHPPSSSPPMRSTWPRSLSLSSITTAADPLKMGPHDSGGRILKIFASARDRSYPEASTLAADCPALPHPPITRPRGQADASLEAPPDPVATPYS